MKIRHRLKSGTSTVADIARLMLFPKANIPHVNSFNFIRLVAAGMVVLSHSYAITGYPEPHIGPTNLGAVGVWIFFILSGYLISASWRQYPRFNIFMFKRALRIFPGLFGMLVVTALLGVFFTTLPAREYLTSSSLLSYFNNIFLYQIQFSLPGVFSNNPHPNVVNGSLWTLSYEFTMYLAIAFIGASKIYKKFPLLYLWAALFLANLIVAATIQQGPDFVLFYQNLRSILPLALMFFTGVVVQERVKFTENMSLAKGFGALVLFVISCVILPNLAPIFAATFLAYAVFALGTQPHFFWVQRYGDYSYGIYIYAFPIQQAIYYITQTTSVKKMFILSLFISTLFGAMSWFLIEKPALRYKTKLSTKRYPLTTTDEAW